MPQLTEIALERLEDNPDLQADVQQKKEKIAARHDRLFAGWATEAQLDRDASPVTLSRLAEEVWDVIKAEDWVLSTGTLRQWARKLWDFDKPYQHGGETIGTSTQIGMSLGVALAHKGSGKIVVALQPDGDLMYDAGALWTAAKHRIPMLIVMFNNRAYYNDWHHQIRMAKQRGTDVEKAYIGMDITDPDPDFATIARGMGMFALGPIDEPEAVAAALLEALEVVKAGKPALVDIITQQR
jgi:acetolactate synthase-1/2/3 large subunit